MHHGIVTIPPLKPTYLLHGSDHALGWESYITSSYIDIRARSYEPSLVGSSESPEWDELFLCSYDCFYPT